jgi:putative salt-induced outer membrane protein
MKRALVLAVHLLMMSAAGLAAQTPDPAQPAKEPPPPPPWTGSIGAGLALTSGNTDTFNINLSFDASSNPKARNIFKTEGLYLRGDSDDELTVNRAVFKVRDQYQLTPRSYVFGQLEFLRDPFKSIQYLWAPTFGAGYKLYEDAKASFTADAGLGLVWEKNPYRDVRMSGAVTAGEDFVYKFSETASFTESFDALWVMDDFSDALYTFKVGVAGTITKRSQVKLELVDVYKTKPPDDLTKKNDVAVIAAIVYKF